MQGMQAWLVMILIVALATGACASQPRTADTRTSDTPAAAIAIDDVEDLAGKWHGWYIGASGSSQPLEVDVSRDGTYRSRIGSQTGIGSFKVENGKILTTGQLLGPQAPFERNAVATLSRKNGKHVISGRGESAQRPYSFEIVKD